MAAPPLPFNMDQSFLGSFTYRALNGATQTVPAVQRIANHFIYENDWLTTISINQGAHWGLNMNAATSTTASRFTLKKWLLEIKAGHRVPLADYLCVHCDSHHQSNACNINCYVNFKATHLTPAETKIHLKETRTLGVGVFVRPGQHIARGDYIGEYIGKLKPPAKNNGPYVWSLNNEPRRKMRKLYIDAGDMGNWTRFVNHACRPNVDVLLVQAGKVRMVLFRAAKSIRAGQQLFINYGRDYFKGGLMCRCNAKKKAHHAVGPDELLSEDDNSDSDTDYQPSRGVKNAPTGDKRVNPRKQKVPYKVGKYRSNDKLPRRLFTNIA